MFFWRIKTWRLTDLNRFSVGCGISVPGSWPSAVRVAEPGQLGVICRVWRKQFTFFGLSLSFLGHDNLHKNTSFGCLSPSFLGSVSVCRVAIYPPTSPFYPQHVTSCNHFTFIIYHLFLVMTLASALAKQTVKKQTDFTQANRSTDDERRDQIIFFCTHFEIFENICSSHVSSSLREQNHWSIFRSHADWSKELVQNCIARSCLRSEIVGALQIEIFLGSRPPLRFVWPRVEVSGDAELWSQI